MVFFIDKGAWRRGCLDLPAMLARSMFLCCPWHCAVLCKLGARHRMQTTVNGVLTSTLVSGLELF